MYVNLSGNTALCNKGLLSILRGHLSSLQRLDLSACGLASPLDQKIIDKLKLLSQSSETPQLQELDLSFNHLDCADKKRLAEAWNTRCQGNAAIYTGGAGQMCLMCQVAS